MKRVLIVDDAIDLGRTLQDALKLMHPDIPVSVVPSAEEALLESTRYTIDLLVTDLRLPGMSGYELIRKIRVRQPNVKVILMTGLSSDDPMVRQNMGTTIDIFMRKPISAVAFLDAVDNLIAEVKPAEQPVAPPPVVPEPVAPPSPRSQKEAAKQALLDELAGVLPGEPAEPKPEPSKKLTGRLQGHAEPTAQPAASEESLSAILTRLRSSLGLLSVMLLDERGHPVAQAGDLPDLALEEQIISPMMASMSSGARISYLLGLGTNHSVQAYRGTSIDLVLAPVGQFVLLLAIKVGRSALRLALAFEEALNAQPDLLSALEAMGLHVRSTVEMGAPEVMQVEMKSTEAPLAEVIPPEILETPLGQDLNLEKFEELFSQKKTGALQMADADSFWDSASSGETVEVSNPGMLNWEQAQKLGLLPSDKD